MKQVVKIVWILCFQLVIFIYSNAQEGSFDQIAKKITSFNFKQLAGGVILLKAQFSDFADSLNFILDTGSGGVSLDSTTLSKFNITPIGSEQTIVGIGGIRKVSFVNNKRLVLPGLSIDSLNFHINDYEILSNFYGEKIDGIIGYSVLSRYIFQINFDSTCIHIYTKGKIKYPKGGWLYNPILYKIPIQEAKIYDATIVEARFLFDIGAGLSLMLNKAFVNENKFIKIKKELFAHSVVGIGGAVDLQLTVIKRLQIGPYKFNNIPTLIFEDSYNVTSYPYLFGIIGNDLLRRFNLTLNYANREFYFIPNTHYNDFFDYAYSGAELYLLGNKIVISNVAKNSPAEKAGLKEGDIIISVNNFMNQNLQAYKQLLQATGDKIKMIVQRDYSLHQFEFKIKSIL